MGCRSALHWHCMEIRLLKIWFLSLEGAQFVRRLYALNSNTRGENYGHAYNSLPNNFCIAKQLIEMSKGWWVPTTGAKREIKFEWDQGFVVCFAILRFDNIGINEITRARFLSSRTGDVRLCAWWVFGLSYWSGAGQTDNNALCVVVLSYSDDEVDYLNPSGPCVNLRSERVVTLMNKTRSSLPCKYYV